LVFEFSENEYFNNLKLEKSYTVSNEYLLEKIESSNIEWKEGKNISAKKVTKKIKNKSKEMYYLFNLFIF